MPGFAVIPLSDWATMGGYIMTLQQRDIALTGCLETQNRSGLAPETQNRSGAR